MNTGAALADVRRAEDRLSDAVLDRRRVVRGWLWRALAVGVPFAMLGLGVQAAILDGLDPAPDTRAVHGALLFAFGIFGSALAVMWMIAIASEQRGSLRRQNDTVRARRREVRDARDVLAVARETATAAGVSDAEDIVARWSPPTNRKQM